MSKEVRTTATRMSIDPETVPEGMMELTFRIPVEEAENVRLGSPVTLVLPEAVAEKVKAGQVGGYSISEREPHPVHIPEHLRDTVRPAPTQDQAQRALRGRYSATNGQHQ